ncbi:MAG: hypothetical protein OEW75_03675 [Cyclobacteriaceae bacterium]|nr:hypothetical protein [Cyclobacteriaceae bacterium]
MKIYIGLCCVIFLISSIGFSQNITYLGFEGAVTSDKYEIFDPCETITSTQLITGSWGLFVGQQIHKNLFIESGILWKYYDEGYETLHYEYPFGPSSSIASSFYAFQIPIRLTNRINLKNEKLFLNTTLGYHVGINRDYDRDEYGNTYIYDPNDFIINTPDTPDRIIGEDTIKNVRPVEDNYLTKNFGLIEAGLGLEYFIGSGFTASISASYFVGLNNVTLNYISTGISNKTTSCTSDRAVGTSKGSYSNLRLSIKYDIGRFWRKENQSL